MGIWIPLIIVASIGTLVLYVCFLRMFKDEGTQIAVFLGTIVAIAFGVAWAFMGLTEVVIYVLYGAMILGVLALLYIAIATWLEVSTETRKALESAEQAKLHAEQERLKEAELDRYWAEERRKDQVHRAEYDRLEALEAAKEAERREADEMQRRRAEARQAVEDEERRKKAAAEKARRARIIAERDPDMPF